MTTIVNMQDYLEQSGRTAADLDEVRKDMYDDHHSLLHDVATLIVGGNQADLMKRSLFYKEPMEKVEARAQIFNEKMDQMYNLLGKLKTAAPDRQLSAQQINILHACFGVISEAAETMTEVANSFIEDRDLDLVNLREEAGDKLWYLALELRNIGGNFEQQAADNIQKLAIRYPDKFNSGDALNRDYDKEKIALT